MSKLTVFKEVGKTGYFNNTDQPPYNMPPGAYNQAHNIEFTARGAQSRNGARILEIATADKNVLVIDYQATADADWLVGFTATQIYSYDFGPTNISRPHTPLSDAYDPLTDYWEVIHHNGVLVATNGLDVPQGLGIPTGSPLTTPVIDVNTKFGDLPGFPATSRAKHIVSYKNFIIAADIIDNYDTADEVRYPNMIWWSDISDPGTLPLNWDYADPTSLSGRNILGIDTGAIVAMRKLRDDVIIYTEHSTHKLSFVPVAEVIFKPRTILHDSGIFNSRCVTGFQQYHLLVTQNDICIFDGTNKKSIADGRVRLALFEFINRGNRDKSFVVGNLIRNEIWICFPRLNTYADTALIYNYLHDTWGIQDVAAYFPELSAGVNQITQIPNIQINTGSPDYGTQLGNLTLYAAARDQNAYNLDVAGEPMWSSPTVDGDSILSRFAMQLSTNAETSIVLAVYPEIEMMFPDEFPTVEITVGSMDTAYYDPDHIDENFITWETAKIFDPTTDYRVTFRSVGRYHCIRFKGYFKLSSYIIEHEPTGRR